MAVHTLSSGGRTAGHPPIVLQDAATTGDGDVLHVNGKTKEVSVYVDWGAGVGAGQVIVESASSPSYAGTWAPIATLNYLVNAEHLVQITGYLIALRARISSDITGGTVTVTAGGIE